MAGLLGQEPRWSTPPVEDHLDVCVAGRPRISEQLGTLALVDFVRAIMEQIREVRRSSAGRGEALPLLDLFLQEAGVGVMEPEGQVAP